MRKSIALLALLATTSTLSYGQKQPNIIIILGDDVGYGDIEWLKELKTIKTPNVKRIADEGIRFSNAHCTSATSTPSRYGLLTGKYPWRRNDTQIADGDDAMIIKPEQYTIADLLKDNGYKTAAIGKWHLGLGSEKAKQNWNKTISPNASDLGFDYSYLMAATADRTPCVFIENGTVENLDPNDTIEVSYTKNFAGEPTGKDHPELLRMHPSHGHNMSIVNGISRIGYMKGGTKARWRDEDIADKITQKATEFIQQNSTKPFFLYFGTNDIHVPRMPHERFQGKSGYGLRGDAILSFDYSVGQIVNTLDSLGIADNTILIITSDNGPVIDDGYKDKAVELLGNHKPSDQYRGGKYSAFEAGTRIPFIIRWKNGIKKSFTNHNLLSHIDIFASIADIIGAKIPKNEATDSKNYSQMLLGEKNIGRNYIISNNSANTLSITTKKWKYIEPSIASSYNKSVDIELGNNKKEQLYKISKDKKEQKNLANREKKILENLKEILKKEKEKGYLLDYYREK